jgi:hypothetical protein
MVNKINPKLIKSRKNAIFLTMFILLAFANCTIAIGEDITITTSGSGKSQEVAKQNALRSALEQTFGTFISSKTEIFNDQLIVEQMSSITAGNIKSYEILNQSQLPNGEYAITLKAIISIEKLLSFVESKGINIDIKGSTFATNIKQQILNEKAEFFAVSEMVGIIHEAMQIAFDFKIDAKNPISLDSESKNWAIPITATVVANKNMDFANNYFFATLSGLSLNQSETEEYQSLNKKYYPIHVLSYGTIKVFNLRNKKSLLAILSLVENWDGYVQLFQVDSGLNTIFGYKFSPDKKYAHHIFGSPYGMANEVILDHIRISELNELYISFPSSGQKVTEFFQKDEKTLDQIEKMTGYSIKGLGLRVPYKNGGYVVKDYVISLIDISEENKDWYEANNLCKDLNMSGYNDWYLPSSQQIEFINEYLEAYQFGRLRTWNAYWTSTQKGVYTADSFDRMNGNRERRTSEKLGIRPIRNSLK